MRIFNYANLKNHRWDSEILGLVAQIHEFKGKQELYLKQKPATLEKLVEIAKIQIIYPDSFLLYFADPPGSISIFTEGYRGKV